MPHEMPIGIPTTHESSSNSPDPTTALPMPPPSPTGRGVSIKNRRFNAATPRIAMYARIRNRIPTATKVQSAVSEVITALTERRDRSDRESFFIVLLPSPVGRRVGDEGLALAGFPLSLFARESANCRLPRKQSSKTDR